MAQANPGIVVYDAKKHQVDDNEACKQPAAIPSEDQAHAESINAQKQEILNDMVVNLGELYQDPEARNVISYMGKRCELGNERQVDLVFSELSKKLSTDNNQKLSFPRSNTKAQDITTEDREMARKGSRKIMKFMSKKFKNHQRICIADNGLKKGDPNRKVIYYNFNRRPKLDKKAELEAVKESGLVEPKEFNKCNNKPPELFDDDDSDNTQTPPPLKKVCLDAETGEPIKQTKVVDFEEAITDKPHKGENQTVIAKPLFNHWDTQYDKMIAQRKRQLEWRDYLINGTPLSSTWH